MSVADGRHHTLPVRPGWTILLAVAGVVLLSLLLFQNYRAYEIDNVWYLSFSWNYCNAGVLTDPFMDGSFPGGMGGTIGFGKLGAISQCAVLNAVGWYPQYGQIMVLTVLSAALLLWTGFLKQEGFTDRFVIVFVILLGVTEPFVAIANKLKYEYLVFFLLSASLFSASRQYIFIGALLAFISVEIEPIAILVPLIYVCYLFSHGTPRLRALIETGVAGAICLALFLWLHPQTVSLILHAPPMKETVTAGFLADYFIARKRHLPELAIFAAAAVVFWRRRLQLTNRFPIVAVAAIMVAAILLRYGNTMYMILLYPFLLLVLLQAFPPERHLTAILVVVALLMTPQYGYLIWLNRHQGFTVKDYRRVEEAVDDVVLRVYPERKDIRVYGFYGLWPVHPSRYTAAAESTRSRIAEQDVYLCFDGPLQSTELTQAGLLYCPDIQSAVRTREVAQLQIRQTLRILVPIEPTSRAQVDRPS